MLLGSAHVSKTDDFPPLDLQRNAPCGWPVSATRSTSITPVLPEQIHFCASARGGPPEDAVGRLPAERRGLRRGDRRGRSPRRTSPPSSPRATGHAVPGRRFESGGVAAVEGGPHDGN